MPVERIYPLHADPQFHEDQDGQHLHIQWGKDGEAINLGTVHDSPEGTEDKGFFLDLRDRREVNRVIRVLQKARDDSFGSDA
jgi:hypothetical protein